MEEEPHRAGNESSKSWAMGSVGADSGRGLGARPVLPSRVAGLDPFLGAAFPALKCRAVFRRGVESRAFCFQPVDLVHAVKIPRKIDRMDRINRMAVSRSYCGFCFLFMLSKFPEK